VVKAGISALICLLTVFILMTACLWHYAGEVYYPYQRLLKLMTVVSGHEFSAPVAPYIDSFESGIRKSDSSERVSIAVNENENMQHVNHPGNLKAPVNWIIYGGGLIYLLMTAGILGVSIRNKSNPREDNAISWWWFYIAGGSYIALTAIMLRDVPDARFFLPGIYLCLVPFGAMAGRLPAGRMLTILFLAASFVQGAGVLYKTYSLRHVPSGIMAAITYLESHPPEPNRVFMYPEGNYRLFPCIHEWYFNDQLVDVMWQAEPDARFEKFVDWDIGAIVIKKHLIGDLDSALSNLNTYPRSFVESIQADSRYTKVLENNDVIIYKLPLQEEASVTPPLLH
jgi:hypothetical protein